METGADGVMSSEAILEYPPLFTETNVESTNYKRTGPGRLQMTEDYMELCKQYPPEDGGQGTGLKCIRAHLHRYLHADLQRNPDVRTAVCRCKTTEEADNVVKMVREIHESNGHDISEEQLSWYVRHRAEENGFVEEKKAATAEEEEEDCTYDVFGEVCADDDGDY